MNKTVLIPCQVLNLLVKTIEENYVLSVFSLPQLLKKFQGKAIQIKKSNSIPENPALHPKRVQIDHKYACNIEIN